MSPSGRDSGLTPTAGSRPGVRGEVIATLRGVRKSFAAGAEVVSALNGVDLDVRAGLFVCISGRSGSGKTTLLNMLAGLDVPDSGEVSVLGRRIERASEADRARLRLAHIGVVFQANNLLPEFTAAENIAIPLMARGWPRRQVEQAARDGLAAVDIAELADRVPAQMSGGQRQRVGIARALAGEQDVLLADEPTGALDSENSESFYRLLRRLCDERGLAAVLATHDSRASDFADETARIVDGALAA